NDPHPLCLVAVLQRELVVVLERPHLRGLEPPHTEVQKHRLSHPGVHVPGTVASSIGLGDADGSTVEELDRRLHGRRVDRGGGVFGHIGPAAFDPLLELLHVAHVRTSATSSSSVDAARSHASTGGTPRIPTNPSPSGPKNDPGATTMPPRSRRRSAHSNDVSVVGTRTQR